MTGNEMFLLKRGCGALELEDIVKDIQEKKDNAIAMEFTKCIGELLKKNGVVPKMTEYTGSFEANKTFGTRYGVTIDELDFSEHDKVFENEIAGLKAKIAIKDMDYKTVSGLLSDYQKENESLKQRIAELESRGTEKSTKYITVIVAKEINGKEYVRLEDFMSVVNDLQAQIGT